MRYFTSFLLLLCFKFNVIFSGMPDLTYVWENIYKKDFDEAELHLMQNWSTYENVLMFPNYNFNWPHAYEIDYNETLMYLYLVKFYMFYSKRSASEVGKTRKEIDKILFHKFSKE